MRKTIVIGAISDLHNDVELITKDMVEDCDIVIVAGDLTDLGSQYELEVVMKALNDLDRPVFVVYGNHDVSAEVEPEPDFLEIFENIRILQNSYAEYDGLKMYGSPYSGQVAHWAFGFKTEAEMKRYLPTMGVDILITHGGPNLKDISTFQTEMGAIEIGSDAVTNWIRKMQPLISISGHTHECGGNADMIGHTRVYNVAKKLTKIKVTK